MRINIHTGPLRLLFVLQCLEEIKDTGIHSKILPFIILNILRNRHMLQFFPENLTQSILYIFSLMIAADRLADSAGLVLFLGENLPRLSMPGII